MFFKKFFNLFTKQYKSTIEEEPTIIEQPAIKKELLKVALIVGHSHNKQGAKNKKSGTTEYMFNDSLVDDLMYLCKNTYIYPIKVYRDTYKELPDKVNKLNPHIAITFHCNAFNTKTSGSEVLYYYKSNMGERIAEILQNKIVATLGLKNRGAKPIKGNERGGYLLLKTTAPAVIIEPFFIDNDSDLNIATTKTQDLVRAIFDALIEINQYIDNSEG